MIAGSGRSFRQVLKLQSLIEELAPAADTLHVGTVVVLPTCQRGREGTRLMQSVTTIADEQQPDAFLQTGRAEDVELCERFGFRVTEEATFYGEPVWAMLKLYSATVHRTETDGTRQHPSPASQCARLHGPGIFS